MLRRWAEMIGEEHWLADPRFKDDQLRADNGEIISARMNPIHGISYPWGWPP
jgi:hypothetical protein